MTNPRPRLLLTGFALAASCAVALTGCATQSAHDVTPAGVDNANLLRDATADDGRVMSLAYRNLATSDSIEPTAILAADNASLPWAVNITNPEASSIFIVYLTGEGAECGKHLGVSVYESDSEIVVASVSSSAANLDACASTAVSGGEVTLARPIGNRKLLHAAVSPHWSDAKLDTVTPDEREPQQAEQTITAPPYTGTATCTNLLDPQTVDKLKAAGQSDTSANLAAKAANEPQSPAFQFLQRSGIVCSWGAAQENEVAYAFSPVTDADAAGLQKALTSAGFGSTTRGSDTVLNKDSETYALGKGYWVWAITDSLGDLTPELSTYAARHLN